MRYLVCMSEYYFGLGNGNIPARLAARVDRLAAKHGATLVRYTEQGCKCGGGCARGCKAAERYWFAAPNRGAPHNDAVRDAVTAEIAGAGLDISALGTTKRPGRTPRPDERRGSPIPIALNQRERDMIEDAARLAGVPMAVWVRDRALDAARR